jgi:hypothetical protein
MADGRKYLKKVYELKEIGNRFAGNKAYSELEKFMDSVFI